MENVTYVPKWEGISILLHFIHPLCAEVQGHLHSTPIIASSLFTHTQLQECGVKVTLDGCSEIKMIKLTTTTPDIPCACAQGSCLAPLLFSLDMLPFDILIRQDKINYHGYADDAEWYISVEALLTNKWADSFILTWQRQNRNFSSCRKTNSNLVIHRFVTWVERIKPQFKSLGGKLRLELLLGF